MLRLMCGSCAVWVLVEESICRIPEEGTRTQDGVITLCAAFLCWPGSQGLVSTSGLSGSLSFMEGQEPFPSQLLSLGFSA